MNSSKGIPSETPATKPPVYKRVWFQVVASLILFAVFVSVLVYVIYIPFVKPFANDNHYTLAMVGASNLNWGVIPEIIDEKTGESAFLLNTKGAPLFGRYRMLHAALQNPDLKNVVIEVSYDVLSKHPEDYTLDLKLLYFSKVQGIGDKIETAAGDFSFWDDEYDQMLGQLMFDGLDTWRMIFRSSYADYVSARGFNWYGAYDQSIDSAQKAADLYNSKKLDTDFPEQNIRDIERMIAICKEKGLNVLMMTVPCSQKFLWTSVGLDDFHAALCGIADRNNITYFDFNLMQDISRYLDDSTSFRRIDHLSGKGAEQFSPILGEVLHAYFTGDAIPYAFYDSYEEVKEHSIYRAEQMD